LYGDGVSVLLVREGVALPTALAEPADSAWHQIKLAADLSDRGELAAAEEHFRSAVAMPPRPRSACSGLARTQMRAGKSEEAWRTARECQRLFPSRDLIETLRRLEHG
jgi:Flp pilus assembly protein TadD